MLFTSMNFAFFFLVTAVIYWMLPLKWRNTWLLLVSYIFYSLWSPFHIIFLLLITGITYMAGLLLERKKYNKIVVGAGVIICFGILVVFKYSSFIVTNINALWKLGFEQALCDVPNWSVPIGISFYIFQATAYLFDVYHRKREAEHNIVNYALYVAFFPTIMSGPIERATTLLPQIRSLREFDYDNIRSGLLLILEGVFLKLVVDERLSILVNAIFEDISRYAGLYMVIGAVAFSLQIYCNFKSYSDMAIGIARVLGFKLTNNFAQPYFATSVVDFWRRWHISLSSWFRDYIYFPLGGSRCGKRKLYRNLMIVFLVSGIWHGANWTFLLWGALNGLLQIMEKLMEPIRNKVCCILEIDRDAYSHKLLKRLCTFAVVTCCWVFFRANTITDAFMFFERMFLKWNPWIFFDGSLLNLGLKMSDWIILYISLSILLIISVVKEKKVDVIALFLKQGVWFRYLVVLCGIFSILIWGIYGMEYDASSFIYFRF